MAKMTNTPAPGAEKSAGNSGLVPARWIPLLITVLVGAAIWFYPPPAGVDQKAWHLLAIFVATIVGLIAKPLPMGAVAIIGICVTALTGTLSINDALSGFGNNVVWLIAIAFFVSRAFIKTGLGARIGYLFMYKLGKKSLGLAYGMAATDLVLAPAMPSNTARAGGVVYPLVRSVAAAYGSAPDDGTNRAIGAFLIKNSYQVTVITSATFMTAMAANPLAAKLAGDAGVGLTWGGWFLAALVPALVSLAVIPWFIYKVYPPEIKETPTASRMASDKLREMGKIKPTEWVTLGVFFLLLALWIGGEHIGLDSTTAALVGLGVLLLSGALTWQDILNETGAWDTLVWFASLVMMATFLDKLGFVPWFGAVIGQQVTGIGWAKAFLVLSLVYFYSHYLFASQTAHISAMYASFLAVAIAVRTPPTLAALVLAFFSNLFASLTHYAAGPAPVLFGSGYVPMGVWWGLGGGISVINIFIWVVIGGAWWKMLGLW
jgi:DASS family divalent anion:Na+ symporter